MRVISNIKKEINSLKPGDVIAYWDSGDNFKSYAIFSMISDAGFEDTYKFVALNTTDSQRAGSDVHYGNVMNRNESSSSKCAFRWLSGLADHVEKVPFFGVEGHPENYESKN